MPIPDEVLINSYFKTPNIGNGTHWGVVKNKTYDEVDIMLMSEPEEGVDVFQKSLSIKDDLLPIDLDNKWLTNMGYCYNYNNHKWERGQSIFLRRAGKSYVHEGYIVQYVHQLQGTESCGKYGTSIKIPRNGVNEVSVKINDIQVNLGESGYLIISDWEHDIILNPEEVYLLKRVLTEKDFI